jgi:hypothetical protein
VQVCARRHEEDAGSGRIAPGSGAIARVWRVRRRQWGEWSREGLVGCRRARPSSELRRRPSEGGGFADEEGAARVNVSDGFSSRASESIERAAADAQTIASRIAQNTPRSIFFTASVNLQRLLKKVFCSSAR